MLWVGRISAVWLEAEGAREQQGDGLEAGNPHVGLRVQVARAEDPGRPGGQRRVLKVGTRGA